MGAGRKDEARGLEEELQPRGAWALSDCEINALGSGLWHHQTHFNCALDVERDLLQLKIEQDVRTDEGCVISRYYRALRAAASIGKSMSVQQKCPCVTSMYQAERGRGTRATSRRVDRSKQSIRDRVSPLLPVKSFPVAAFCGAREFPLI
jgi:hypothetical protein